MNPTEYGEDKHTLKIKDGRELPLISLNFENDYAGSKYKGKFQDVCKNYLWWR